MAENLRKLPDISIEIDIQFRAKDNHYSVPKKIPMEITVRKGNAVGRYEEICVIEVRSLWVKEGKLDRPLPELGSGLCSRGLIAGFHFRREGLNRGSGT